MAYKPQLNKFAKLKQKIKLARADIVFLKKCQKKKVYPNFIKLKCSVQNSRTEKVIKCAKDMWLKTELQYHYSRLSEIELETYSLHLEIVSAMNAVELDMWNVFCSKLEENIEEIYRRKTIKQDRKFKRLSEETQGEIRPEPAFVDNFVHNLSDNVFEPDELQFLNKGLKFIPKPKQVAVVDAVVDLETVLKYKTIFEGKKYRLFSLLLLFFLTDP